MQVSEIMHKGITAVNVNDSVRRVAELMRQEDIGVVPVLENDKPVGFVTDRDIVISCVAEGYSLDGPISHAMNEDVFCVKEDQDIEEATRLMEDNQVSRILVIDDNERPIGMLNLHDLSKSNNEEEIPETLSKTKH